MRASMGLGWTTVEGPPRARDGGRVAHQALMTLAALGEQRYQLQMALSVVETAVQGVHRMGMRCGWPGPRVLRQAAAGSTRSV